MVCNSLRHSVSRVSALNLFVCHLKYEGRINANNISKKQLSLSNVVSEFFLQKSYYQRVINTTVKVRMPPSTVIIMWIRAQSWVQ